jgi:hypothetical protein
MRRSRSRVSELENQFSAETLKMFPLKRQNRARRMRFARYQSEIHLRKQCAEGLELDDHQLCDGNIRCCGFFLLYREVPINNHQKGSFMRNSLNQFQC